MSVTPPNEKAIFNVACSIESIEARSDYLRHICRDNQALLERIATLLRMREEEPEFLAPPPSPDATIDHPIAENPGSMIGPYRILEEIGRGGMGIVYIAEQREPVRRKIALKVIKPGLDTREVIARFEAERQALALMDHPNIAKVLDAGATESGRPYFAMELVRGVPITNYCDECNLTTRERLELFTAVCHAVKHAHQKGIIHRDVKPSNVLISLHDGTPMPIIIDFGVAKAIAGQLTDKTIHTRHMQLIGTPLYMSPEQAELRPLDIDVRTDIYSLGVLLYELLTGTTPFDKECFREAAYDEVRRIIREEDPPKPSTRISSLGDTATDVSSRRQTDPRRLGQSVRGDLDCIVMKALEKDRTRRYETASELAADVARHLNNEPVLASPPSAIYKLRKFVRRNKAAAATMGLVAASLVLGLVGTSWQAVVADRAKDKAVAAEKAAVKERDRAIEAEREKRRALYISDMASAVEAWEDGNTSQLAELLERHRPKPGDGKEDLRGFEWYYLWRLCGEDLSVPTMRTSAVLKSMEFSPDGRSLATVDIIGNVAVWDVDSRKRRFEHSLYGILCGSAAYSPDGQTVASAGFNESATAVSLWDGSTGELRDTIPHLGDLYGAEHVDFSPDGKLLAVECIPGSLRLWDVAEGCLRSESLKVSGPPHGEVSFAPVGTRLAVRKGGRVKLWDWSTDESQWLAGTDCHASCIAFTADGKTLVSGNRDGVIRFWDVATATQRDRLRVSHAPVTHIAISSDGNTLASSSFSVKLWDLRTLNPLGSIRGGKAGSLAFSPDGKTLACANSDSTVRFWPVRPDGEGTVLAGHTWIVVSVAVSPDGSQVASGSSSGEFKSWDLLSGRETVGDKQFHVVSGIAFSPDGSILASCSSAGVSLRFPETGEQRRLVKYLESGAYYPLSIAFSPDGRTIATGGADGRVFLFDVETGSFGEPFPRRPAPVRGLAFSPDSKMLALTVSRKAVQLWNVATRQLLRELVHPGEPSGYPSFSENARVLACGSLDGDVGLWDVASGKLLQTLRGHVGQVASVVYSPDGESLFSAGYDGTIRIWSMRTHRQRASLTGHKGIVLSLAISPDMTTLVSGGADGTVRLWRAATEEDPEKLAESLKLDRQVRMVWSADVEEQQQGFERVKDSLAAKIEAGLDSHELAAAHSVVRALRRSSSSDAPKLLLNLAEAFAVSDQPKLRELANRLLAQPGQPEGEH